MFDAHCHLTDPRFSDPGSVILRSNEMGVRSFAMGGVDPDDWDKQLILSKEHPRVYPSFGLHPWFVARSEEAACEAAFKKLESMLANASAIGETGLDFHERWPRDSHERQINYFERHADLAERMNKPLIIHSVKAHQEVLRVVKNHAPVEGIVHGFHGSYQMAKDFVDVGLHISIGPHILKSNTQNLEQTIGRLPLLSLVVESDAPDQKPKDFPSETNEPWVIVRVIEKIAKLKQLPIEDVRRATYENMIRVLRIERGIHDF